MPRYRNDLPQLDGNLFLTNGGLETTIVFHEGIDLSEFAAFVLLENEGGREILRKYYRKYADIARDNNVGFILESMSWRASRSWGEKLGYSDEQIAELIRAGIALLEEIRIEYNEHIPHIFISGCIGPHGDGYNAGMCMTEDEGEKYHLTQIATFKETEADMVAAFIMTCTSEAKGVALAAETAGITVVISFTVETDGRLPSRALLKEAIHDVDAAMSTTPAYYMINCAHPTHFLDVLGNEPWTKK